MTTTFMGMGALPADDELFVSTTGLQSRDYISCGFDRAELTPILKDALLQNVPAIIDCPVDYSENLLLSEKLGRLICPM